MQKTIVITGSSRGIGFGLANRFLEAGCRVMLNGSSADSTRKALASLSRFEGRVFACAADMGSPAGVEELCREAAGQLGRIDIWINNAGISHRQLPAWELATSDIDSLLRLNIGGVVHGTLVPFRKMVQDGGGLILNMEGLGSDGMMLEGMALYGTSKSALRYFTRAVAREARTTPVRIGSISPGMVVTDLLRESLAVKGEEAERRRRFFNLMADEVEEVSGWLCGQILASTARSPRIVWLTRRRMLQKVLAAPFRKRRLV